MDLADLKLSVLEKNTTYQFDCDDSDLNDFFHNDSHEYQNSLLSKTFCWSNQQEVVAFVSIFNDNVELKSTKKKKKFPGEKHMPYYPAVKIGRLGINKKYQKKGLGSQVLSFLKYFFIIKNKTGCRFLTLDAYNKEQVTKFYCKNNFSFMTTNDKNDDTRAMYYDLILAYNSVQNNPDFIKQFSDNMSNLRY